MRLQKNINGILLRVNYRNTSIVWPIIIYTSKPVPVPNECIPIASEHRLATEKHLFA